MSTNGVNLLIIDPQVDFCDPKIGKLYVNGAEKDMDRLGTMIRKFGHMIDRINVTLDSHQTVHIAHPIFWSNSKGEHPTPFTIITADDVANGTWKATNPAMQEWGVKYVNALRDGGRYPLCVWPEHCLIGSQGATVTPVLYDALLEWEKGFRKVNFIPKGSCVFTEHYSAVKAEIVRPDDSTTMLNSHLINVLKNGNDILIGGEASSHCVANTLRDIVKEIDVSEIKKFVIIDNCMSPVLAPGIEHFEKEFFDEMRGLGVRFAKSTEYFN